MNRLQGRKRIARETGLTGVEAENILRAMEAQSLDVEAVDWEAIGQDLYGHGSRTGGVKHHLAEMYGINLVTPETAKHLAQQEDVSIGDLIRIFERRTKASKKMDLQKSAKGTFPHTDARGVKLWKKHPNEYDIIGVDDPIIY